MTISIGDKLGPYEILSLIGEGGMGQVWKARDTRLDRIVAVKLAKEDFTDRFEREARSVAALNHPHICQLYDVGPNYLVMELIDGSPLQGPLRLGQAVEYAGQILDALAAAHSKKIIHRDLKPANILVTRWGIKLLDFGLAKQNGPPAHADATIAAGLTKKGEIAGTLQYMAPEQLQGKDADARSDLFAFGCVLYEMLSGKCAFDGSSAASVIAAVLERQPEPLSLAPPLDRVIRTCLEKDPDRRFQTALDLKRSLSWAADEQPAPVMAVAPPSRRGWIAAACATGLTSAGAYWAGTRVHTPTHPRVARFHLMPPEGGQFRENDIALSPDGRWVAFVANVKGNEQLWVRPIEGEARALAGTGGASFIFWSPDSRAIGYHAASKIWRIDVAGGAPLAICDAPNSRGASWSDYDTIVLGSGGGPLRAVRASGGSVYTLTSLDEARSEHSHRWPQALDTGQLLYWAFSTKEGSNALFATSLAKPRDRVALVASNSAAQYAAGHLLWRRGSTLVAQPFDSRTLRLTGRPAQIASPVGGDLFPGQMSLSASRDGSILIHGTSSGLSQFTWVDRAGHILARVGEPAHFETMALAPDGRRLAASKVNNLGSDLWILDLERKVSNRFTAQPGTNNAPVWSPDGRTIIFRSGPRTFLYRKDAGGAGGEEMVLDGFPGSGASDWSRDGRHLLVTEQVQGGGIWILPLAQAGSRAEPRRYIPSRFRARSGRFSPEPNPRWVAYQSEDTERVEIYVQSFPEPRGKVQISTGGGQFPAWSPDGREIYYVSPEYTLMAVSVQTGTDSITPSPPRELFLLRAFRSGFSPYAVAKDGRFLVNMAIDDDRPLKVILNWPALVR